MKSKSNRKIPGISYKTLSLAVKEGNIQPCYLFAGAEQYIANEALKMLSEAVIPKDERSFNYDVLYGGDVSASEIAALASSYPMMGEKRMVIVKDSDKLTNIDQLTSYIKDPLSSTVLVLVNETPDFRKNPYRIFQNDGILACVPLYEDQVPGWISNYVKKLKKRISEEAANLLANYTGVSLRQVVNEIDKLDIYTGSRDEITADDVNSVVGITKSFNIFELQKALGRKQVADSINILERMLDRGEYPPLIVSMLTRFFVQLSVISDLVEKKIPRQRISAEINVPLFFLDDYIGHLRYHTPDKAEDRFKALLHADIALKTTGSNPRVVLTMLLYQLVDKEPVRRISVEEMGETET